MSGRTLLGKKSSADRGSGAGDGQAQERQEHPLFLRESSHDSFFAAGEVAASVGSLEDDFLSDSDSNSSDGIGSDGEDDQGNDDGCVGGDNPAATTGRRRRRRRRRPWAEHDFNSLEMKKMLQQTTNRVETKRHSTHSLQDVFPHWLCERPDFKRVELAIKEAVFQEAIQTSPQLRSDTQQDLVMQWFVKNWEGAQAMSLPRIAALSKSVVLQNAAANTVIFREASVGDTFHIIIHGTVVVTKGRRRQQVGTMRDGQGFGELALSHDQERRTATVKAKTDVQMFVVRKAEFNRLLKAHVVSETADAMAHLRKMPLFKGWSRSRLTRLCELLHRVDFKHGDVIIKQGDPPEFLYFLMSGKVRVFKEITVSTTNRWPKGMNEWEVRTCNRVVNHTVGELGPGSYFGEKAIVENSGRHASVISSGPCVVMALNKIEFLDMIKKGHALEKVYSQTNGYPSDDDVLHLFTALRIEKKRDKLRDNIRADMTAKQGFSPNRDEIIARSVAQNIGTVAHVLPTEYGKDPRKSSWVLSATPGDHFPAEALGGSPKRAGTSCSPLRLLTAPTSSSPQRRLTPTSSSSSPHERLTDGQRRRASGIANAEDAYLPLLRRPMVRRKSSYKMHSHKHAALGKEQTRVQMRRRSSLFTGC